MFISKPTAHPDNTVPHSKHTPVQASINMQSARHLGERRRWPDWRRTIQTAADFCFMRETASSCAPNQYASIWLSRRMQSSMTRARRDRRYMDAIRHSESKIARAQWFSPYGIRVNAGAINQTQRQTPRRSALSHPPPSMPTRQTKKEPSST